MQLSLEGDHYSFERFNKIQRKMLTQFIAQVIEQEGKMREDRGTIFLHEKATFFAAREISVIFISIAPRNVSENGKSGNVDDAIVIVCDADKFLPKNRRQTHVAGWHC